MQHQGDGSRPSLGRPICAKYRSFADDLPNGVKTTGPATEGMRHKRSFLDGSDSGRLKVSQSLDASLIERSRGDEDNGGDRNKGR